MYSLILKISSSVTMLALAAGLLFAVVPNSHAQLRDLTERADVLGAGDSIRVTVFQHPDLTTEGRISSEGVMTLPLVGQVDLTGLSNSEAVARIALRYREGQFLKDPQVSVAVLQVRSRQVTVQGQVVKPGRYALDEASPRLTDVLALAGGISPTGDDTVTVMTTRDGKPQRLTIDVAAMYRSADMSSDIEIRSGDTIFVQRAPIFYIYGEVQRSGAYRLERDLTVVQALSLGGGVTPRGTERGIRINRRTSDGALERLEARPADRIRADDVIYVQESMF